MANGLNVLRLKRESGEVVKEIDLQKNPKQHKFFNTLFHVVDKRLVLNNSYKEYSYFGGFRSGKSYALQLAVYLLCSNFKCNGVYIRDTYDQLKDSVIKQFLDDFQILGNFEYLKAERKAIFRNGSILTFRSFENDTNILSNEYDFAAICQAEDVAEELFLQVLGRLSGRGLSQQIVLVEGNPANTWVKKRYKDQPSDKIFFIEGKTEDNAHNIPPGYIDFLKANYSPEWIERYVYGGWNQLDEMVFNCFRDDCVIDPVEIDKDYTVLMGLDLGWKNPSALVWVSIDFDNNYTIFDEWAESEKTPAEIAEASLRHGKRWAVADYAAKRPDRDGLSLWNDLESNGMDLVPANKSKLRNITLINSLFKTGRLKITRNCVGLIKEIQDYKWKRLKLGAQENLPEEPIKKDDHRIDSMCYVLAHIEFDKSIDPKKEKEKKTIKGFIESQFEEWEYKEIMDKRA